METMEQSSVPTIAIPQLRPLSRSAKDDARGDFLPDAWDVERDLREAAGRILASPPRVLCRLEWLNELKLAWSRFQALKDSPSAAPPASDVETPRDQIVDVVRNGPFEASIESLSAVMNSPDALVKTHRELVQAWRDAQAKGEPTQWDRLLEQFHHDASRTTVIAKALVEKGYLADEREPRWSRHGWGAVPLKKAAASTTAHTLRNWVVLAPSEDTGVKRDIHGVIVGDYDSSSQGVWASLEFPAFSAGSKAELDPSLGNPEEDLGPYYLSRVVVSFQRPGGAENGGEGCSELELIDAGTGLATQQFWIPSVTSEEDADNLSFEVRLIEGATASSREQAVE